jgi:type VI protein secretion system component VasF
MIQRGRSARIHTVMALWLVLGLSASSQTQQSNANTAGTNKTPAGTGQKDSGVPPQTQPGNKTLSPAEQKRADLIADAEKLYQLTQELKAEVAKSNKDTLSVSVVKKAQEVERLAKSIKERSRAQ